MVCPGHSQTVDFLEKVTKLARMELQEEKNFSSWQRKNRKADHIQQCLNDKMVLGWHQKEQYALRQAFLHLSTAKKLPHEIIIAHLHKNYLG